MRWSELSKKTCRVHSNHLTKLQFCAQMKACGSRSEEQGSRVGCIDYSSALPALKLCPNTGSSPMWDPISQVLPKMSTRGHFFAETAILCTQWQRFHALQKKFTTLHALYVVSSSDYAIGLSNMTIWGSKFNSFVREDLIERWIALIGQIGNRDTRRIKRRSFWWHFLTSRYKNDIWSRF